MDETTRTNLENIHSKDKQVQNDAYFYLMDITSKPVDWAYDVWDETVANLTHNDNHERAIAAQLLCNLAVSDPEKRILHDFDVLLNVTRDERFVTARHCLQNIWKVGLAGAEQKALLLADLSQRYNECITEKNCTLIRYDIIQTMKNLYDAAPDEAIKTQASVLIETESDTKYRKKYAKVWK
jgi:hypothetical protein